MKEAYAIETSRGARWVLVRLGAQNFAIEVGRVRELRRYAPPTPVPQSPAFMLGLLDMRGVLIPILDLGLRLGLAPVQIGAHSIIVVISEHRGLVGLLVDQVCDLLNPPDDALRYPPSFSKDSRSGFVGGAIAVEGAVFNVLRTENIVSMEFAQ